MSGIRNSLLAATLAVGAVAALVTWPLPVFVPQRLDLARWLVSGGFPSLASRIYLGLAWTGNATAQNNVGVLIFRGYGLRQNRREAEEFLRSASDGGSAQAATNLAFLAGGHGEGLEPACGVDAARSAAAVRAMLPRLSSGDRAPAGAVLDCLYFAAARARFADPERVMVAAARAVRPDDGAGRLKAGKALLAAARTMKLPDNGRAERSAYEERVTTLLDQATADLFAAAELGRPEAYDWLSVARLQFARLLPRLKKGAALQAKSREEWLELAATSGDWSAACRAASGAIIELERNPTYSRAEFGAVVARAKGCIDRKEAPEAEWSDFAEYPLLAPHPSGAGYPHLEIGRTAADLSRLLFSDAAAQRAANGSQKD